MADEAQSSRSSKIKSCTITSNTGKSEDISQLKANQHALNGAIQQINRLMSRLDKPAEEEKKK